MDAFRAGVLHDGRDVNPGVPRDREELANNVGSDHFGSMLVPVVVTAAITNGLSKSGHRPEAWDEKLRSSGPPPSDSPSFSRPGAPGFSPPSHYIHSARPEMSGGRTDQATKQTRGRIAEAVTAVGTGSARGRESRGFDPSDCTLNRSISRAVGRPRGTHCGTRPGSSPPVTIRLRHIFGAATFVGLKRPWEPGVVVMRIALAGPSLSVKQNRIHNLGWRCGT